MESRTLLEEGAERLKEAQLPSGGWGYHAAGQPFVEPTALGLLALAPFTSPTKWRGGDNAHAVAKALATLVSWQKPAGCFGATPEDPDPSWATAPALLALLAHGSAPQSEAAAKWLVGWRAPIESPSEDLRKEAAALLRTDVTIPGWPWQGGELFATVEPTALASIALRAWKGPGAAQRISDALRYFEDRACRAGGWNYGNPYFHDDALTPITLPTAKGLLAVVLCGKPRGDPLVSRASAALAHLLERNPSRKAHAWGAIAFAALGDRDRVAVHVELAVDSGDGRGPWGGTPDAIALALLALRASGHQAPACLTAQTA